MNAKELAEKHGVSIESIQAELGIGEKVESEHYSDLSHRRKIALDHLEEIPDYYTRLKKMEKEAKEGGGKKETPESKDQDKRVNAAWRSLAEKESGIGCPTSSDKKHVYFPSVSIEVDGADAYTLGEDIQISFKVNVEGIRKMDKGGYRVDLKLKEIKD